MMIKGGKLFNFASTLLLGLMLLYCNISLQAQQIAFPGAEGFGKYATGGREGQILKVTNLDDEGSGSLRDAIEKDFPRIIVFEVSGTIYLKSKLKIRNGDVTIAGQTAPGHGITLAHYNLNIDAENVIIRHIRCRLSAESNQQDDALTCTGSTNIIIDHCSFSWSVDEVASLYHNKKLTMQNCIIAESFHNSIHDKGAHGYGGIWGGDSVTFHHNLIMHNTSRNPRFHGARWYSNWEEHVDFRNNVIYNWASNTIYGGERSEVDGSPVYINMVNNYYKYGPATSNSVKDRILDPDPDATYGYGKYYIDGNYVFEAPEVNENNWLGVHNITELIKDSIKSDTAFAYDITTIHSAIEAYDFVIQNVGACIPYRDSVDTRLLWEVVNDTAIYGGLYGSNTGIVDNLDDIGGYPGLFTNWAPKDSDNDGIPDFWEIENGLDPYDPDDAHEILEGFEYPAIEEYINGIVISESDFLFHPTNLNAKLTDIKEISLNWENNTNDESEILLWRSIGDEFECIDTLLANTTTCADTNVEFNTTYLYKVQAINDSDSSVYSNIASETTLGADGRPKPAEDPFPTNGATNVSSKVTLSWTPGIGSTSHDVYLGSTYPPPFIENVDDSNYKLTNLDNSTRYYWRIDEVNENGTTEGEEWAFVTRSAFPEELIAHFSFDQPIIVDDVSGNGIKGTGQNLNTTDFVDGVKSNAIQFDGVSKYCEYPHNEKVNFDINAFTISFWINQDLNSVNKENSHRYIVKGSNVENETEGHSGKRYEVYYTPNKNIFRFCVDDNDVKSEVTADENYFLTGNWVHVAAVRDTTNKKLLLYANAELISEVDDLTGNISQDEPMYISYCVDETGYVDGTIDEVQLYGYALSNEEINKLYQEGSVAVQDNEDNSFSVYPNPTQGLVNIINETNLEVKQFEAYNILGKKIYEADNDVLVNLNKIGGAININLSQYSNSGSKMFFLVLKTDNKIVVKKLLIQ